MTVRRSTLEARAAQERVIAALLATGHSDAARRLGRCMEARAARRSEAGWPWTCRTNAGCAWCRKAMARRWWKGLHHWITREGAPVSLAVVPLRHDPGGLRPAAARLRRGLRDVRDRTARRRAPWKAVAIAGMATGDGTAVVLVRHPGITQAEVADALGRRWPDCVVGGAAAEEPTWRMTTEDAADLARARRGVEPLRIVVLPRRAAEASERGRNGAHGCADWRDAMPIAF